MARVTFGTFSLDAPKGWTLSSVILSGPVDESPTEGMLTTKAVRPFQRNVIATLESVDEDMTAEDYVGLQIEGLKAAGVARSDAGTPETVTLANGASGLLTEQIIQGPTGERVRQMQLVFVRDEIAHTIIASHLDGRTFESARKEFRQMLLSFA